MRRSREYWPSVGILVIVTVGCNDRDHQYIGHGVSIKAEASAPLISEELRAHHFGAVISRADRKLKHEYRLVNKTNHDVKIIELVNRKPCCGEVRTGKTTLHPNDEADVEVTISVRQEFGDIVHETAVLTEPPQAEDLVLRTTATAFPAFRVEEVTPANGTVLLSSDKPKPVEFLALACGSSNEPLINLNRVVLRSTTEAVWLGPKENAGSKDCLTSEMRRFTAVLDPAGPAGERKTGIVLESHGRPCYTHVVSWEVVSPMMASPKTIVVRPSARAYRVRIQSRDQALFRITRIECGVPGIRSRAASLGSAAQAQHVVEVELGETAPSGSVRSVIKVFTDHPAQERVDVPFIVLE